MVRVKILVSVVLGSCVLLTVLLAPIRSLANQDAAVNEEPGVIAESVADFGSDEYAMEAIPASTFSVSYFGVFYGPSVGNPSVYQLDNRGRQDRANPVITKNYLGVSYNLSEDISVTPTGVWLYQPVLGQQFFIQDPFIKLSHGSLINSGRFNLYGDIRVHMGVTDVSRQNDLMTGVETFQVLSYDLDRLSFGLKGSVRYNVFGRFGTGNDLELYLAPSGTYQVAPGVAMTLLYEMGGNHVFGQKIGKLVNDGTTLKPGVAWMPNSRLEINPYLVMYPGNNLSLKSTGFGMTVWWQPI